MSRVELGGRFVRLALLGGGEVGANPAKSNFGAKEYDCKPFRFEVKQKIPVFQYSYDSFNASTLLKARDLEGDTAGSSFFARTFDVEPLKRTRNQTVRSRPNAPIISLDPSRPMKSANAITNNFE